MSDVVQVALITLLGQIITSWINQKLLTYRIDKLEEAVKENGKIVSRVYALEQHNAVQDTLISGIQEDTRRLIGDMKAIKGA